MPRAISKSRQRSGYHSHRQRRPSLSIAIAGYRSLSESQSPMRLHGRSLNRCLNRPAVLLTVIGAALGFAVTMCVQSLSCLPPTGEPRLCSASRVLGQQRQLRSIRDPPERRPSDSPLRPSPHRELLLVGIMTAQQYVDSRAYNVWKTWAQHVPGQVVFFIAENTVVSSPDLPVVRLIGVDDTYPPQKKSFAMLRWMADHGVDKFDWFLRADDDLYVRGDRLETFLRSLDANRALMIGQAGLGTVDEFGQLSLADDENYCMGGPGVLVSHVALRTVRPHLAECLRNMFTTHEDVEVGRCIRKHVGVSCTWNYEMQTIFYNNQSGRAAFTGDLNVEEVHQGTTLHPIKLPPVMRRVHSFVRGQKVADLRFRSVQLSRDARAAMDQLRRLGVPVDVAEWNRYSELGKPASLLKFVPQGHDEILHWDMLSPTNVLFCSGMLNCPRHNAETYLRSALSGVIRQVFELFNRNARQRGRTLQFQNIQYAYHRVDPLHGADYVIDMILWFKKFRGPHRATISVRRHAYIHQPFGQLEAVDDMRWRQIERQRVASKQVYAESLELDRSTPLVVIESRQTVYARRIHMVLPLSGRAETFKRFANHFRTVCLDEPTEGSVSLVVVLFPSGSEEEDAAIRAMLQELMQRSTRVTMIEISDQPFSRGVALARGAASVAADELLFFTDVDMLFSADSLRRIRLNTIFGRQVYFPIVFSEYAPDTWSPVDKQHTDAFHYGRRRGYFRHFGFGLVSLYRADLDRIGGLDTHIQGWGMEDVDLFEKCLKHADLRVFRAPDPGLVHIYHPVRCPPSMPAAQYKMCIGSKAASYSSADALVDRLPPVVVDGA